MKLSVGDMVSRVGDGEPDSFENVKRFMIVYQIETNKHWEYRKIWCTWMNGEERRRLAFWENQLLHRLTI